MNQVTTEACFFESKNNSRLILLEDVIGIPALSALGFATNNQAKLPLIEHSHRDKIEFVIMIDGIQKFIANKVDFTLYRGDVFVAKPNEPHTCIESDNPNNAILWFQIDLTNKQNFLGQNQINADFLYQMAIQFAGRKFQIEQEHMNCFVESFHLIRQKNLNSKIKGQNLFLYALIQLLEQKPILKTLSNDIDYAKQYIQTHIKEAIDVDELIGNSSLTASQFKQKFKEQIGQTPREYVNFMKIQHVKEHFIFTKGSLTDLAFEYHFSSYKYFKTLFKRYTGYSPKKYRRLFSKNK